MKSGIVTFGESKHGHMKDRTWVLGDESVAELYEYKNLGFVKNYMGSFSTMIITIKFEKKPVCYFPRTLTCGRSTL